MEWIGSHKTNIYRAGHKGKVIQLFSVDVQCNTIIAFQVDVKCMTVGVGNHFYPDHLLVLGMSLYSVSVNN